MGKMSSSVESDRGSIVNALQMLERQDELVSVHPSLQHCLVSSCFSSSVATTLAVASTSPICTPSSTTLRSATSSSSIPTRPSLSPRLPPPFPLPQRPNQWRPTSLRTARVSPHLLVSIRGRSLLCRTKGSTRTIWSSMSTKTRAPRHPERPLLPTRPSPRRLATRLPTLTRPSLRRIRASLLRPSPPLRPRPSCPLAVTTPPHSGVSARAWEVPQAPRLAPRMLSTRTPGTPTTRVFSQARRQ